MVRRQRGVALIELVIASVIFAMAMLGMFQAWSLCFSLSTQGREEALASQIGRAELEISKIQGFDNVPLGTILAGYTPYRGAWSDTVRYYDVNGVALAAGAASNLRFFSSMRSGTDYGVLREQDGTRYRLAPTTLRSILVTVKRVAGNETLRTMGLHLTKGGL
ncbi:MAG: prepilin-type N-terminal cleavage/methylation domain-containing protein [Fimbriimonas sp.]